MERTFHHNKHELHGITVVVDVRGGALYIGRCHDWTEEKITLHDVAIHEEGKEGDSSAEFVRRAARFGHWAKHGTIAISADQVLDVRRLGDVDGAGSSGDSSTKTDTG